MGYFRKWGMGICGFYGFVAYSFEKNLRVYLIRLFAVDCRECRVYEYEDLLFTSIKVFYSLIFYQKN